MFLLYSPSRTRFAPLEWDTALLSALATTTGNFIIMADRIFKSKSVAYYYDDVRACACPGLRNLLRSLMP